MRIGFDAKRAFFNRSGLGNYSRNLLNAMFKYYPDNEYILYSPRRDKRIEFTSPGNYELRVPQNTFHKLLPSYWRSFGMGRQIGSDKAEIYHGLSAELPFTLNGTGVKKIVTVHDLIYMRYPHLYGVIDRKIYFSKLNHACRHSDRIIAISKQTRDDIIHYTGTRPEKIGLIYQDCNPAFYDTPDESQLEAIKKKYKLPGSYLLYVGTIEERKNLLSIIKAMKTGNIKMPLIVVGRKTKYFNRVAGYIAEKNMKNIHFLDEVDNLDLPLIYRLSSCFVYPSVFEGFGIPIIEALVSGVPVITSKGSCFSEAGGPGSVYVDPHDPVELAAEISRVINNKDVSEKMISEGRVYAGRFRAEIIAAQYMDLYRSMT